MSISEIPDQLKAASGGKVSCGPVTMDYLDGGARGLWRFPIGGRTVELTVPASTSRAALIELAIAEALKA